MGLKQVAAVPHPAGNRIDLHWEVDGSPPAGELTIVRSTDGYPATAEDGTPVPCRSLPASASDCSLQDCGLQSETVYYYSFFLNGNEPLRRVSAMATGPYGFPDLLYRLLPAIYRRYDEAAARDGEPGELRRFLELPGGEFDRLYSYARALLELYNVDRVDGQLLRLLADWIGWRTDHRQEIERQRAELRFAPFIQETVGIIPTVEATVQRLSGWECRTKEFANNVFLTDQPERLNLWWMESVDGKSPGSLLSLDSAYEGQPAVVSFADKLWLLYHTLVQGHWEVWYKTRTSGTWTESKPLRIPLQLLTLQGAYSLPMRSSRESCPLDLRQALTVAGLTLSEDATIERQPTGDTWLLKDPILERRFALRLRGASSTMRSTAAAGGVTPYSVYTSQAQHNRHPSAVAYDNKLWVFWDAYDEGEQRWRIVYTTSSEAGKWEEGRVFLDTSLTDRRQPRAVVQGGSLLLLWLERGSTGWRCQCAKYEPTGWTTSFPGPTDIEDDLFAFAVPDGRLWVFGAARKPVTTDGGRSQRRWRLVGHMMREGGPGQTGWPELAPPKPDTGNPDEDAKIDEREPGACLRDDRLELYWSSTRDGSWGIWRSTSSLREVAWDEPQCLTTDNPYSQRTPIPAPDRGLVYRSSESVSYPSRTYSATTTLDTRYAGSTTVAPRNTARRLLRGKFDDFETYIYDAGPPGCLRTDNNWYARDTIGIYHPEEATPAETEAKKALIRQFLSEFLPIQTRVVFIPVQQVAATGNRWEETLPRIGDTVTNRLVTHDAEISAAITEQVTSQLTARLDELIPTIAGHVTSRLTSHLEEFIPGIAEVVTGQMVPGLDEAIPPIDDFVTSQLVAHHDEMVATVNEDVTSHLAAHLNEIVPIVTEMVASQLAAHQVETVAATSEEVTSQLTARLAEVIPPIEDRVADQLPGDFNETVPTMTEEVTSQVTAHLAEIVPMIAEGLTSRLTASLGETIPSISAEVTSRLTAQLDEIVPKITQDVKGWLTDHFDEPVPPIGDKVLSRLVTHRDEMMAVINEIVTTYLTTHLDETVPTIHENVRGWLATHHAEMAPAVNEALKSHLTAYVRERVMTFGDTWRDQLTTRHAEVVLPIDDSLPSKVAYLYSEDFIGLEEKLSGDMGGGLDDPVRPPFD